MENGIVLALKILSVSLKLKFKCRMRLDYKDNHLTL